MSQIYRICGKYRFDCQIHSYCLRIGPRHDTSRALDTVLRETIGRSAYGFVQSSVLNRSPNRRPNANTFDARLSMVVRSIAGKVPTERLISGCAQIWRCFWSNPNRGDLGGFRRPNQNEGANGLINPEESLETICYRRGFCQYALVRDCKRSRGCRKRTRPR